MAKVPKIKRKIMQFSKHHPFSAILLSIFFWLILGFTILITASLIIVLTRKSGKHEDAMLIKLKSTWKWVLTDKELSNFFLNSNMAAADGVGHSSSQFESNQVVLEMKGLVKMVEKAEEATILNPHPFHFTLNPGHFVCSTKDSSLPTKSSSKSSMHSTTTPVSSSPTTTTTPPTKPVILIYIHSAPKNYHRRLLIRETWGSDYNIGAFTIRTIFMCGTPTDHNTQQALIFEYNLYKDIVQEDFVDSYRNLTYKAVMSLKWVSTYCQNAHYVIKSDDDIFVDIFKLVSRLEEIRSERIKILNKKDKALEKDGGGWEDGVMDDTFVCNVWDKMKVIRNPNNKWYLSTEEYPEDFFGRYCSGSVYVLRPDLASKIWKNSLRVPFFWVDDYYITGMVPIKARMKISYVSINNLYFLDSSRFLEKFKDGGNALAIGHSNDINHHYSVWKMMMKRSLQEVNKTTAI